jgi:hypothetical protein
MRKLLALMASLLAACGSSSSSGPSYAAKDWAVTFDSGSNCSVTGTSTKVGASVAFVDVTDYTNPSACVSMQQDRVALNGAAAAFLVVRAAFSTTGGTVNAPGLTAATYSFFDLSTLASGKIPPFDNQGDAVFFTGAVAACGAAGGAPAETSIVGGTVKVDAVDPVAGTISGSISATLSGGGSFTGSFATTGACAGVTLPATVCQAIGALNLQLPTPTCS